MYRDLAGGYGFASPFKFDSLLSLVLYYATNTMEKHNPELETMLKYPACIPCGQEPLVTELAAVQYCMCIVYRILFLCMCAFLMWKLQLQFHFLLSSVYIKVPLIWSMYA